MVPVPAPGPRGRARGRARDPLISPPRERRIRRRRESRSLECMALIRGGALSTAIYMQMTNIFLPDGRFLYTIESILAKRIKIAVPGRRFSLVGDFILGI